MVPFSEEKSRLDVLRKLLRQETANTQEDLREKLEKSGYKVTQSTISRDLRRLGAVRVVSANRQAIYRLSSDEGSPIKTTSFSNLVLDIKANGTLVVIHTSPGSASLVARHLDHIRPGGILGTLAGDDTIFVALSANRDSKVAIKEIEASFRKNS